jgi:hypothetical protein
MKEQFVFDPLISKRQQYLLATQLVRSILKIDDVVRLLYLLSYPICSLALPALRRENES